MKLIDTATGKEIAAITSDHGLTMEEAIRLAGMEDIVIDPSTEEIGYRDTDGDEHWYENLDLAD